MKTLTIIFAIIICIVLYIFSHTVADHMAKDLFEWGYWTGLIISFVLDIVLRNI